MVPKYCFRVMTTIKVGGSIRYECRNFELLQSAMNHRLEVLAKPLTKTVTVLCVIDETTKGEYDDR